MKVGFGRGVRVGIGVDVGLGLGVSVGTGVDIGLGVGVLVNVRVVEGGGVAPGVQRASVCGDLGLAAEKIADAIASATTTAVSAM